MHVETCVMNKTLATKFTLERSQIYITLDFKTVIFQTRKLFNFFTADRLFVPRISNSICRNKDVSLLSDRNQTLEITCMIIISDGNGVKYE